jgi:hypothetical protein
MADGKSAFQLFSGFYYVEHGANRWTAKKFSVLLGAPPGSREKGAMLRLELTVPESIIDPLKSVTLAAAVNGTQLAPETYNQIGHYTYAREVPPQLLAADPVKIDFVVDKSLRPPGDGRELGLIARGVGLQAK